MADKSVSHGEVTRLTSTIHVFTGAFVWKNVTQVSLYIGLITISIQRRYFSLDKEVWLFSATISWLKRLQRKFLYEIIMLVIKTKQQRNRIWLVTFLIYILMFICVSVENICSDRSLTVPILDLVGRTSLVHSRPKTRQSDERLFF